MSPREPSLAAFPVRVTLAVTALVLGATGFLPLFGGPGYEASLVAGALLPSAAAVCTALVLVQLARQQLRRSTELRGALGFGIAVGALLAATSVVLALLHGLRVGFCDLLGGLWLMLLGPGFGAVMGGAWGALAAVWTLAAESRRPRNVAVALALAGPAAGVALSLWRFFDSPVVFAFDPFFGYFAGPLYDTVIEPIPRLASYRAGSLATLLAGWALSGLARLEGSKLVVARSPRWGQTLAGVAAAGLSVLLASLGPTLGHNVSNAAILEVLARSEHQGRCEVRYDPSISKEYVRLLARDCEAHLVGLERYFETTAPERVRVLLFANAGQKGRLMGAANTFIAKPWRHEVYLQQSSYPHPVLRHELAHVVAGRFGQGPFKIAGAFGGWLPDPGRIEGFAEAAAPREDSDFTVTEWAAAMADVGLLPPLERVFQLSFLSKNASTAYTAAGAFVVWLRSQYGPRVLTAWYRGAELEQLTRGKGLRALEAEFRKDLAQVELSPRLKVAAQARFSLPSIFGRRCPHAVDAAYGRAQTLMGALDIEGAEAAYREVLSLDPNHVGARLGLGTCAFRRSDAATAIRAYRGVADDGRLALGNRLGAREAIADAEFLQGRPEVARDMYSALLTQSASEDHRRTLEVKRLATTAPAAESEALRALLLGSFRLPPSWDTAAPLLGAWRERDPSDGLASYLLARNLFNRALTDSSAQYLDESLARELALESVRREALRLRVIVGCARRESDAVRRSLQSYLRQSELTTQQRDSALAIASRCGVTP